MVKNQDNQGRPYRRGLHCSNCGKFVGKDGDCDLVEVEEGILWARRPFCGKCLSDSKAGVA